MVGDDRHPYREAPEETSEAEATPDRTVVLG